MFGELGLIIDTNEKDVTRTAAISEFFESNGAAVTNESLRESSVRKESLDYKIEGLYKENNIDLVIEYKTIQDFASSWQDLEDRLFRALQVHAHVALVIEHGAYGLSNINTTRCMFKNPAVPDGSADVLPLAVYEAKLEEWILQGIHVRLINSCAQFPTTVLNLLNFIIKPNHGGLRLRGTDFRIKMLNLYSQLDGIGIKTAEKLLIAFPNLYHLSSYAETHLQECIGKKRGQKLWEFLHNQELITDAWRNHGHLTEEVKPNLIFPPQSSVNDIIDIEDIQYAGKYTEVKPNVIDSPTCSMSLKERLKEFFADGKSHTMQEIVDTHKSWGTGYVFDCVVGAVKSGYLNKNTDEKNKITFKLR